MEDLKIQNGMSLPLMPAGIAKPDDAGSSSAFGKVLENSIQSVNQLQQDAESAIEGLTTGKGGDIHRTMIAMEQADISFQLVLQVRNKLISAYEEIMRMQV